MRVSWQACDAAALTTLSIDVSLRWARAIRGQDMWCVGALCRTPMVCVGCAVGATVYVSRVRCVCVPVCLAFACVLEMYDCADTSVWRVPIRCPVGCRDAARGECVVRAAR
jgi:hypothetical protein